MEKTIFHKLDSIEYDRNRTGIFGIKSAIIWGHNKNKGISPLLYISKPRSVSQEDYEYMLDHLKITFENLGG